jgi:cytochrome c553
VLAFASTCLLLSAVLVAARGQQAPAVDFERFLSFGDSDLDGKLSRDEFRELLVYGPRLKKAAAKKGPARPELLFDRLDTDHDGFLSVLEFRRLPQMRFGGPNGGGMAPFAKAGLAKENFAKGAFAKEKTAPGPATSTAPPRPKASPSAGAGPPITPEQLKFFETRIRPVLVTKCSKCHASTAEKVKGGLFADSRDGLRNGGETGPAVVPGDLDGSLLITAIRYKDDSLQMPPKTRLPDEVVADFEKWIRMGAPDPRDGARPAAVAARGAVDIEKVRQFWAFQPLKAVSPPAVHDRSWPRSDIDRFLLSALESQGLKPVADAGRHALIRRVSFDLTGLPPKPEEVLAFVDDPSEEAFARVVDRLLASPRFGERWGRHWLDVARFAESSGNANMIYPQAWRYRDWVIAAFNDDMPYDQFVKQQIAGDLLPAGNDRERAEHLIATGFLALGNKIHNTQNRAQFLLDLADEQIDVAGQAFLGLTIACARCHDHKFDPISQRDYYALSGIFQSTQTCYGTLPGLVQNANPSPLMELPREAGQPSAVPGLNPERRADLEAQLAELVKTRHALTEDDIGTPKVFQTLARLAIMRFRLASFGPDGDPRTYAMGARERSEPINSPLYIRGELDQPGEQVPRGFVQVLGAGASPTIATGSGRRELAEALVARDNPLTARVMVNRIWLHLIGRGLVPTPDNFGAAGQPASHPELLDALAVSFMDENWSVKKLIRRIVLSRAYQLGSTHDLRSFEVDPDNTLIWRMSPRRLEAEALRDAVLAISGKLELKPPVGSAAARAGEGPAGPFRGFDDDSLDMHRAVYLAVVRDQLPESLTLFDFADPSLPTGERSTTSGPPQALYLMNSPFVIRQAEAAANRLRAAHGDDDARVEAAYLRFLARMPTVAERKRARDFLAGFLPADTAGTTGGDRPRAAWTALCQALYASAEFRYLD